MEVIKYWGKEILEDIFKIYWYENWSDGLGYKILFIYVWGIEFGVLEVIKLDYFSSLFFYFGGSGKKNSESSY